MEDTTILGGGYTCSVCGQYQRTSAVCHHNNFILPQETTNKIPTALELLKNNHLLIENDKTCEAHTHLVVKQMVEFAKMHVKMALKLAAEELPYDDRMNKDTFVTQAILKCYPEINIK